MGTFAPAFFSALLVTAPSPDAGQLAALVERFGIDALEPTAAPEIALPDLEGGTWRLAEQRGRWLLLTFFATWCGPCASEMPSLEALHRASDGKGFAVIGVGFDGSKAELAAFARQRGAHFPIVVDQSGAVAAQYRAHSIPMSYLVDPRGRLVGISRGARDWQRAIPMVEALLGVELPDGAPPMAPGQAALPPGSTTTPGVAAPVELPPDLVPPSGTVVLADAAPVAGTPFVATVDVTWSGELRDYILQPPRPTLPAGLTLVGTGARSSSEGGRARIAYDLTLLAAEAGSFSLDPIELRFVPTATGQQAVSQLSGPKVVVGARRPLGLPAWGLGVLGGSVLVAGLGVALGLRRRGLKTVGAPPPAVVNVATELAQAQRLRLDGAWAKAFLALVPLAKRVGAKVDLPKLEAECEGVRYGGVVPSEGEVMYLERAIERTLGDQRAHEGAKT